MGKRIAVLGGDQRFAILARLMAEDGHQITTFAHGENCAAFEAPLHEAADAQFVVLPLPLSRVAGYLNGESECPLEQLWSVLRPEQKIYAGSVRAEDLKGALERGLQVKDYYDCEELAIRNAVPTAEGAIGAAMAATDFSLQGASCFVVGYGRIGKILSHKLRALGAKVSVSARRKTDIAWIEAMGFDGRNSCALAGKLGDFRLIFNTVPHELLGEKEIEQLRSDCVLIELASASGFDLAAVQRRGLKHVAALALPGKVAPECAAEAIRSTLYSLWEDLE